MIRLTRLGHGDGFLLNPDLFERIDSYVDTVVRLTNGSEYVVSESPAQIIERIVVFRAQVLAAVPLVNQHVDRDDEGAPVWAHRTGDQHPQLDPPVLAVTNSEETP